MPEVLPIDVREPRLVCDVVPLIVDDVDLVIDSGHREPIASSAPGKNSPVVAPEMYRRPLVESVRRQVESGDFDDHWPLGSVLSGAGYPQLFGWVARRLGPKSWLPSS
jgi:hypothetical protein